MAAVARGTLEVLIGWGADAASWPASFAGDHDDVSEMVSAAVVQRGRDDPLEAVRAGTASLTLRDAAGLLNYANAASPLYGQLTDRTHPVRIRVGRAGVYRSRFYGLTRNIRWQPHGRKGAATIACVDLFYWLERAKPIIVGTGPTTTGAAIGLILDSINWTDPAARVLADGDDIPDFFADGSKSGLQLVAELLVAERGVFYIAGDGRAIYEDRYARLFRFSEATLADRMTNLEPEVDFDLVRNRVRVSRLDVATGDVIYIAEAVDADSVSRIGYADADEIVTPYLETDDQADALAAWILPHVSEPTAPVRDFVIDGRDAALLDTILDLDLVDRLTISESVGGSAGGYHVERHTLRVAAGGRVSATLVLSTASGFGLLTVAADDTDTGAGVIAADDSDTAAGVLVY